MHLLAALTITLQLADAATTLRPGGRELNPVVVPLAGHPAALYGVKAAEGVGLVLLTRSKAHPTMAFWTRVAINVAQGIVVVHNLRAK